MAIYNTTDIIDNSMFLKAKLPKNMVSDNYYIENLQDKRNLDWSYRYNVVGIEEELHKQINYTSEAPVYTPIDTVITHVKDEYGKDLGTDWAHLSFQNLRHPNDVGYRYRFSLDFPDMEKMSEEDKYYNTSVWICVNKNPIKSGNACTVRRCNTALTFVGSPTRDRDFITEVHYEPCALDNNMRFIQVYYNETVPVPQAEWYATMQLNYFTNQVQIGDRFLFGTVNLDPSDNNQAYKVKAIVKASTSHTFVKDAEDEMNSTQIITLALDKDLLSPGDDLVNRIANSAPVYLTEELEPVPVGEYYINPVIDGSYTAPTRLMLGETGLYKFGLFLDDQQIQNIEFTFTPELTAITEKNRSNYYDYELIDSTAFSIKNKKTCNRGPLNIIVSCIKPDSQDTIQIVYPVELGGFY